MTDPTKCTECPACINMECLGLALYGGKSGGRKSIHRVEVCPKKEAEGEV